MGNAKWEKIEQILDKALDVKPEEREQLVNTLAGEDTSIYSQVIQLLKSIEEADTSGFLERSNYFKKITNDDPASSSEDLISKEKMIGRTIGAFKLTKVLGSGGMSVIYKGERQVEPTTQKVAIKILNKNIHDAESLIRFRMEQEILANLNHPNIAHFIDSGITNEGNPYFIMEFVEGGPVTEYCKKNALSTDERLEIFKQVCRAVSFAHRNMVVHRDLKPNNVFITQDGRVKVLDFSIAKLLEPIKSNKALLQTQTGIKLLSPTYCAPEQFQMDSITTATDVYTLGLLLYEILEDRKVIDGTNKSIKEIERTICESNFGKTLTFNTGSDLKAIILKATRKEPEYRYESAASIFEDIERYKDSLPLLAQQDTASYRTNKFFKRHQRSVGIITLLLLAAFVFGFYHYQEITEEREIAQIEAKRASATTSFLMSIFQQSDIDRRQQELTAKQIMDSGLEKTFESFQDQPHVKEYLLRNMAFIYSSLGYAEKADSIYNISIPLCKEITQENAVLRGKCFHAYGSFLMSNKSYVQSADYLQNAIDIFSRYPEENFSLAASNMELGWIKYEMGDPMTADSLLNKSINYFLEENDPEIFEVATNQLYLGWAKNSEGKYVIADSLFNESISTFTNLENRSSWLAKAQTAKARNLFDMGRYNEALPASEKAIQTTYRIYGENTEEYGSALKVKGLILMQFQQYEEAKEYLINALNTYRESPGKNTKVYNVALNDFAIVHFRLGNHEKAIESFKDLIASNKLLLGPTHPEIASGLSNLATIMDMTGQTKASIPHFEEAIKIAENNYPATHPYLLRFKNNASKAYIKIGDFENAEELILNSINTINESKQQNSEYDLILSSAVLLYEKWGKQELKAKYDSLLSQ